MKKFLALILLLNSLLLSAQKQATNWHFGYSNAVKFENNGDVSAVNTSKIVSYRGCSSVSNCNGDLLFYTSGTTVWTKDNIMMSNGYGLRGGKFAPQSATIVKKPNSSNLYYIFTASDSIYGVNYSIVDMNLDSGKGRVIEKNVFISDRGSRSLCVVKHPTEEKFWVILEDTLFEELYSFLLDSNGLSTTAVVSPSLSYNFDGFLNENAKGCLKASPDGTKLIDTSNGDGYFVYYDFDPINGVVSNGEVVDIGMGKAYGVEFSSNSKVLYITYDNRNIVQFDLTSNNIAASSFLVYSSNKLPFGQLQIGVNNKIYCIVEKSQYLAVINNPNLIGGECNFELEDVLLSNKFRALDLPAFPNSYFTKSIDVESRCVGVGNSSQFTLNGFSAMPPGAFWDFGDGTTSTQFSPTHSYANVGSYVVKLNGVLDDCGNPFVKTIKISDLSFYNTIPDISLCGNDNTSYDLEQFTSIALGSQSPDLYKIKFYTSSIDLVNNINDVEQINLNIGSNIVYVKVYSKNNPLCFAIGQFEIKLFQQPYLNLNSLYYLCKGSTIVVSAPAGFYSYLWSNGSTSSSTVINSAGIYYLTVSTTECSFTQSFSVVESEVAEITNIYVEDFQELNNNIQIFVNGVGNYEYSLDGVVYHDSNYFGGLSEGDYVVYVRDKNGCGVSTRDVMVLTYPKFFTPNGDGYNDTWKIKLNHFEEAANISIFDRYGKLIYKFKSTEGGWNGSFNGENLPSSDYWFVLTRNDGREYKGHFSLKR